MNNDLVQSDKEFESCQLKGESISLWIPLVLALIGIVGSIYITHSLLNSSNKTEPLFSWPSSLITQNKLKATMSTGSEVKNFAEGRLEHVKQASKPFEVDIKSSIAPSAQDLKNEKTKRPSAKNNANLVVLADSGRKASDNDSVLSAPPPQIITATLQTSTNNKPIANKSVKTTNLSIVEQKPTLLQNCPSEIFFTFPRDSTAPDKQGASSKVQQLTLWIKQYSDTKIFIEGHADSFGPEEYNLLLSYRRAKAIEKILIDAGISKRQLITRALGEQEPLQDQPGKSKYNRIVSVRIEATHNCINSLDNGDLD